MKKLYWLGVVLLSLSMGCTSKKPLAEAGRQGIVPDSRKPEYTSNTLIISYDEQVGKRYLLREVKKMQCTVISQYKIIPAIAIRIADRMSMPEAISRLKQVKGVTRVERDRIYYLDKRNESAKSL